MNTLRTTLKLAAGLALTALAITAHAQASTPLPPGFTSHTTTVGDVRLHYVRGGQGEPLVLIHGFPQTWYEWRKVMPELAQRYTVIAPDLRGSGDLSAPNSGYDKATLASDMHALVRSLGFAKANVVGHDIGAMVAHAYASQYPNDVGKLVLLEAPIPDTSLFSFPALTPQGPGAWQFGFFTVPRLPEELVRGKEAYFVRAFITSSAANKAAFTDTDLAEYARQYAKPGHARASFEYFRALPTDAQRTGTYAKTKLPMPVLALGASGSLGNFVFEQAKGYGVNVQGGVFVNSGHWLPEERPEELTKRLLDFLGGR